MKRLEFIKTIGLSSSGLVFPKGLIQGQAIKIYDNYVRGLTHYNFKKVEKEIKSGDELILQREGDNLYDRFAIAVFWQDLKLGYLPAYENIVPANMIDAGVELKAFVSRVNKDEYPYNALAIEVFTHLVLAGEKLIAWNLSAERADDIEDIYRGNGNIEL